MTDSTDRRVSAGQVDSGTDIEFSNVSGLPRSQSDLDAWRNLSGKKEGIEPILLAQASSPGACPPGMVCGRPTYGEPLPSIRNKLEKEILTHPNGVLGLPLADQAGQAGAPNPTNEAEKQEIESRIKAKEKDDETRNQVMTSLAPKDDRYSIPSLHAIEGVAAVGVVGGELGRRVLDRVKPRPIAPSTGTTGNLPRRGAIFIESWRNFRISGMVGAAVEGSEFWVSNKLTSSGHDTMGKFLFPSMFELGSVMGLRTTVAGRDWRWQVGAVLAGVGLGKVANMIGMASDASHDYTSNFKDAEATLDDDAKKRTPASMEKSVDAWKSLGGKNEHCLEAVLSEIRHVRGESLKPFDDTEKRKLAILHAAFGETLLDKGTAIGGMKSEMDSVTVAHGIHYVLEGKGFDIGGLALRNLLVSQQMLNDLKIPQSDATRKQVNHDIHNVLDPHKNLSAVFDDLKEMVEKKPKDADWLHTSLQVQVNSEKLENEKSKKIKEQNHDSSPTLESYILAKVYRDQALLDMAYAAVAIKTDKQKAAGAFLTHANTALDQAADTGASDKDPTNGQVIATDLPALKTIFGDLQRKAQGH